MQANRPLLQPHVDAVCEHCSWEAAHIDYQQFHNDDIAAFVVDLVVTMEWEVQILPVDLVVLVGFDAPEEYPSSGVHVEKFAKS
jgi:hypothetical protein